MLKIHPVVTQTNGGEVGAQGRFYGSGLNRARVIVWGVFETDSKTVPFFMIYFRKSEHLNKRHMESCLFKQL